MGGVNGSPVSRPTFCTTAGSTQQMTHATLMHGNPQITDGPIRGYAVSRYKYPGASDVEMYVHGWGNVPQRRPMSHWSRGRDRRHVRQDAGWGVAFGSKWIMEAPARIPAPINLFGNWLPHSVLCLKRELRFLPPVGYLRRPMFDHTTAPLCR